MTRISKLNSREQPEATSHIDTPLPSPLEDQTQRNITAISALEQQALDRRTFAERFSDCVVHLGGRMLVIVLHAVWFGLWVAWNSGGLPRVRPFDPFPYSGLSTIVSLEAIFLSLFILISQNRASRRADERAQLDLQVNLLAESEATKMLQLLRTLCAYHGLPDADDAEARELEKRTELATLAYELEKQLPTQTEVKQESRTRL